MIYIFIFFISVVITIIYNFFRAEKIICKPPNKFVQVFAPPGTGKTTLASKIVKQCNEENKIVYCNVPIIGARKFDIPDLDKHQFEHCTIIIDEAGTKVGNRNWHTNLTSEQIEVLKLHRHYDIDIYLFSQSYGDVDNKFRELTTQLIMLKKSRIPFRVNACAISKCMDLIGGQIVEYFEWDKANSFHFYTPSLWAYFNSYQQKELRPLMYDKRYTKAETIEEI